MKTKRIVIIVCSVIVAMAVLFTAQFLFLAYGKINVYHEVSPDSKAQVEIKSETGFFEIGTMGGYWYEIVISECGLFGRQLLSEEFLFTNDGATLGEKNVSVQWQNNSVSVTIDSDEMNAKKFFCVIPE